MHRIGDRIKLTDEDRQALQPIRDKELEAAKLMQLGSEIARRATVALWNMVQNLHPELDDYELSINWSTMTLRVDGIREEGAYSATDDTD